MEDVVVIEEVVWISLPVNVLELCGVAVAC